MTTLEEKLGYTFQNTALLENALTHSSCANESRGKLQSNERLEFLGDSILGMVVADHLYRNHPDLPEGELTRTRAALVCEESLVEVAAELNLGEYLRLGKGEESGGGRHRPSIQADAVEAVLAAVYLDGGIGSARKIIQRYILCREIEGTERSRTMVTAARSWSSGRWPGAEIPPHRRGGSRHDKRFFGSGPERAPVGSGKGSKKRAEQMAAKAAIAVEGGWKAVQFGLFLSERAAPNGASSKISAESRKFCRKAGSLPA